MGVQLGLFPTITEARARFLELTRQRQEVSDLIFLWLCRGWDKQAERLYRDATFRSRWWADVVYTYGHYLIRLRRRDRLIALTQKYGVSLSFKGTLGDPWKHLWAMTETLQQYARQAENGPDRARMLCLLGHAYLAADLHELANEAYRTALEHDPDVWIRWENMRMLKYLRSERTAP